MCMFIKFVILFSLLLFVVSNGTGTDDSMHMFQVSDELTDELSSDELSQLLLLMEQERLEKLESKTKKSQNINSDPTISPTISPTHSPTQYVAIQLKPYLYNENIGQYYGSNNLSQIDIGVVGLHNGKTICFINAVMQCLAHIPQLYHFLSGNDLSTTFLEEFNTMSSQLNSSEARKSPIVQFVKLLDSIYRAPMYHAPKFHSLFEQTYHFADMVQRHNNLMSKEFPPNVQQDAHEFLLQLLQRVHMPLSNNNNNNQTVWPNPNLFNVETYDYSTQVDDATQILNGSQVYSQSQMLQLTIPHELYQQRKINAMYGTVSIYDCFQDSKFEVIRPDESKSDLVVRHRLITQTPDILIIHLQRTGFNEHSHQYYKIDTKVEYPLLLDISQFTSNQNESNKYQLIGVVNHNGRNMKLGHYVCYI